MPFPWYDPKFTFNEKSLSYHLSGPSQRTVTQDLMLAFQRDTEHKIRTALIEMGWTPPPADLQKSETKT